MTTETTKAQTFAALINAIHTAHDALVVEASRAVNTSLTLRNWLIGYYIAEYELQGKDRASYGESLLATLAEALQKSSVSGCGKRQLYGYLRFYQTYPQIVRSLPTQFRHLHSLSSEIGSNETQIVRSATALSAFESQKLLYALSYTHFEQLVAIDDFTKRTFYEVECLRGNWSVRELKRQIASLYYERSGLSYDKVALSALAQQGAETQVAFNIRDPYIFEFLGLKSADVVSESHLEQQLTDKLQNFMLELGHGFCFEARQKRILIGDEYFFVDLVFYHRILKCHVLVELKLQAFNHENLGQLNTYVNWYRKNMMVAGDNPPVGLLLCSDKNHALVEYALAGMDNQLFISKYQLELPKQADLQRFIDEQLNV
jgi:predicted nuclease of restriction endonuclease-like (RecB) superfamily